MICTKKDHNLTFYSNFSASAIFFDAMEPIFVIPSISIATADDITYFGDDLNIYPVLYPGQLSFGDAELIG